MSGGGQARRTSSKLGLRLEGSPPSVAIAISETAREAFREAAEREGAGSVSDWARAALDRAAGRMTLSAAADASALPLSEWCRIVLHEAAGLTKLADQLRRAAKKRNA